MTPPPPPTNPPLGRVELVAGVARRDPVEYAKTATVLAGQAECGGAIGTLEGVHTFAAGDYICGPGAAGEYWPVRRDVFEATYAKVER